MASTMGVTGIVTGQSIWSKAASKHSLSSVPMNISHQQKKIKSIPKSVYKQMPVKRKPLKLFVVPPIGSAIDTGSLSPEHTAILFYSAINSKKLKELEKLIAEDCIFEDFSFPKPFQGKKETLDFLEQLTSCMGQNTKFSLENISEGNDYTAVVNWHLDWNKIQVPFTRGCSYYTLSMNGDKLVIERAQVFIESTIKLGGLALTIFKIMTSLFDAFPSAAEWFLKSPHVIFQLLLKTYKLAVHPIISPCLQWYIKLLNVAAFIISFTLRILYHLAKIFNM